MEKKYLMPQRVLMVIACIWSCTISISYGQNAEGLFVMITTNKGVIVAELEFEKAPLAVANFTGLAEGVFSAGTLTRGHSFYNGTVFHRVVPDFVIQGGDPTASGRGGPGYVFPDQFDSTLRHDRSGILSMANSGPNTNGSQFFITLNAANHLDDKHTVFGHVVEGMDVVTAIKQMDTMRTVSILRVGNKAAQFRMGVAPAFAVIDSIAKESSKQQQQQQTKNLHRNELIIEQLKKKYPGLQHTESGYYYLIQTKGRASETPKTGSRVSILYTAKLLDGTLIATTESRTRPFTFRIGSRDVIVGLDQACGQMNKGEKRLLFIPPALGYASAGGAGVIAPDSWIELSVELIDFRI
ncbi:MAG: peptidylprolyl isomerase [Chitinivibrionales bacterium]|nr:peptidylprolyl isomerase [Chitinivibrionales bacterium]